MSRDLIHRLAQYDNNFAGTAQETVVHRELRRLAQMALELATSAVTASEVAVRHCDALRSVLQAIGEYNGEGPPTTDWRSIVRNIGETARAALRVEFPDDQREEEWREWARPRNRNNEATYCVLLLTDSQVPREAIDSWTDEQCQQAEDWAGRSHLNASDHDDVEVPPKPEHVAKYDKPAAAIAKVQSC